MAEAIEDDPLTASPLTPRASDPWTPDFRLKILACALRTDLLAKIPSAVDPALFSAGGPQSPSGRLAEIIAKAFRGSGTTPSPETMSQLVAEQAKRLSEAEGRILGQEWDRVRYMDVVDSALVLEEVRAWVEHRALENAVRIAGDLLTRGPEALPAAREALGAAASIGRDDDDLVRADTIVIRPVPWAWPGYIPRGALMLITGDAETNKSTLSIDLAARRTSGRPFPDGSGGGKPETVIYVTAEDSEDYTILPRFVAMGGDPSRLFIRRMTTRRRFSLETDIARIKRWIATTAARYILIDPLNSFLPKVDSWKDTSIRGALEPLAALAAETDAVIVGIMHLNKKSEYSALQRVLGSVGYTGLARSVYLVAKDPENPSARRLFVCSKMSVAAKPPGLAFTLVPATIPAPDGRPVATLRIAWDTSPIAMTADEVIQPRKPMRPRDDARALIAELLRDGPVLAATAEAELRAAGASGKTLRRMKGEMRVPSFKDGTDGAWYWAPSGWARPDFEAWLAEGDSAPEGAQDGQGEK